MTSKLTTTRARPTADRVTPETRLRTPGRRVYAPHPYTHEQTQTDVVPLADPLHLRSLVRLLAFTLIAPAALASSALFASVTFAAPVPSAIGDALGRVGRVVRKGVGEVVGGRRGVLGMVGTLCAGVGAGIVLARWF